jgi:spore coat polysaccharide biosynthesis protein SpsF
MAAGQFKIGAIIQARLGSTRLPNKVLMPLPIGSNETILSQIIKKIKEVDIISDVIVATSKLPINDRLEEYVKSLNIDCFRGEEEDVLSRFYHISQERNFDYVIRFTGDNPIVDNLLLKEFISNFISNDLDYSCSNNLPLGCNFEMMKASEIIKAHENSKNVFDKEHVTPFVKRNSNKTADFTFNNIKVIPNLRLTIDYASDYALINLIYAMLKDKSKSVKNIINIITENLWLLDINNNNFQKKEFKNIDEEIKNILPLIKERELNRLQKILINL